MVVGFLYLETRVCSLGMEEIKITLKKADEVVWTFDLHERRENTKENGTYKKWKENDQEKDSEPDG
jgi:hypothetical protein